MLIRKDVLKFTLPVIAEQTFIMIMGVINTVMAGRLGKEAVSAIGMVDSINNIFIAFFSALAIGGSVVVAHYTGQGNRESANEAARHTMLTGLVLSTAVTLVIFIFRYELIKILYGSAEQQVVSNSFTYLNITLFTYPLIALISVACGVLRGAGDTRTPMKVTIIMNFMNVILSYVLIYGLKAGNSHFRIEIPGLGVRGAAFGIAAARTIGAVLIIFVLLNGSKHVKLIINRNFKLDLQMFKSILGIGFPASIENLLFNVGKLITQVFIVGMGTASIAANYIAGSIFGLINIPASALSIAATIFVGQYMGRRECDEAKDTLVYIIKASSACLLVVCAVAFPFTGFLVSMYTNNADVIKITSDLIRSALIAIPALWAVSFTIPAGLKGAGDAKYTMFVSVFSMWAFRITLGYVLGIPLKLGVVGVWMGMYFDWVIRGILFGLRLRNDKWKKNVVVRNLDEAM
jgi:putative MATE family efflux protein